MTHVLPNVNTNDWDMGLTKTASATAKETTLICSLRRGSWFAVVTISRALVVALYPSQPQPLP